MLGRKDGAEAVAKTLIDLSCPNGGDDNGHAMTVLEKLNKEYQIYTDPDDDADAALANRIAELEAENEKLPTIINNTPPNRRNGWSLTGPISHYRSRDQFLIGWPRRHKPATRGSLPRNG
jgi:hypothetical protein